MDIQIIVEHLAQCWKESAALVERLTAGGVKFEAHHVRSLRSAQEILEGSLVKQEATEADQVHASKADRYTDTDSNGIDRQSACATDCGTDYSNGYATGYSAEPSYPTALDAPDAPEDEDADFATLTPATTQHGATGHGRRRKNKSNT